MKNIPIPTGVYEGKEPYIFISYAHDDRKKVFPLIQGLIDMGYRVWYDEGVESVSNWVEYVAVHLENCTCMVSFLSAEFYESKNCKRELLFALETDLPIAVVHLDDAEPPIGIKMQLAGQFTMDIRQFLNMQSFLERLTKSKYFDSCLLVPDPIPQPQAEPEEHILTTPPPAPKEETPLPQKKTKFPLIAAAVILLVVLGIFLSPGSKDSADSDPTPVVTEAPGQLVTDSSLITKENVRTVVFADTLSAQPNTVWDASALWGDGAVCWAYENEGLYDVTIAAEGGVMAPEDCTDLFKECTALQRVEAEALDTSRVTSMSGMFLFCSSLEYVGCGTWDTSKVTSMMSMFYGCTSLNEVHVENWDTSKVQIMYCMFYNCESLETVDVSLWNTAQVTTMRGMFYACKGLKELPIADWNTGNVNTMQYMFRGCEALETVDVSRWNTAQVTTMQSMFYECKGLKELPIAGWTTSKVENMYAMFYNCSSLKTLDISGWNTGGVTKMGSMFSECISLTELTVGQWETSRVQDMSYMFAGCTSLPSLSLAGMTTNSATDMEAMFYSMTALTELKEVSNFDVSNVQSIRHMFQKTNLTELDLSEWKTGSVQDMAFAFYDCPVLTVTGVDKWDLRSVTDYGGFMDDGDTVNGEPWEKLFQ